MKQLLLVFIVMTLPGYSSDISSDALPKNESNIPHVDEHKREADRIKAEKITKWENYLNVLKLQHENQLKNEALQMEKQFAERHADWSEAKINKQLTVLDWKWFSANLVEESESIKSMMEFGSRITESELTEEDYREKFKLHRYTSLTRYSLLEKINFVDKKLKKIKNTW